MSDPKAFGDPLAKVPKLDNDDDVIDELDPEPSDYAGPIPPDAPRLRTKDA